jgi:hypothetical protein
MFLLALSLACQDYNFYDPEDVTGPTGATPPTSQNGVDTSEPDLPDDEGAVAGRICDPSGANWVVGAMVSTMVDGLEVFVLTDANGEFLLTGLPPGFYTLLVEKGSFTTAFDVEVFGGEVTSLPDPECLDPSNVDIAVVTGDYDSIELILDDLGLAYDTVDGTTGTAYISFLGDSTALSTYDIVFINCGISWDWYGSGDAIGAALQTYVEDGGSLYVSDWSAGLVEKAYPDMMDWYGDDAIITEALAGAPGTHKGVVLDPNMQTLLGAQQADLSFDYNNWAIAEKESQFTKVLVRGKAPLDAGGEVAGSPLAFRYHSQSGGQLLFTSFHNEAQNTLDMDLLLLEIILSL